MKQSTLLFAFCLLAISASAQLSTAQWRDDLHFLKETVHQKYPNLFYNLTAAQFDAAVDALDARLPQLKDYEVAVEMSRIVAMFRIGHTQLGLTPGHLHQAGTQSPLTAYFQRMPVQLYWFSDGLYIKAAEKGLEKAVGGKVLRVGNLDTHAALEAIRPYTVYENEMGFMSNAPYYLRMPAIAKVAGICDSPDKISLEYEKNGRRETLLLDKPADSQGSFSETGLDVPSNWVDGRNAEKTPLWLREPKAFRYMEYLPDSKVLYVRHSVTQNDGDKTIAAFFKGVLDFIDQHPVEKLVLDVRTNGGGNNYLNKPIVNCIVAARKINERGRFFCIIGRRTFSACQNLVNELEKYTEVVFVGEPTAENANFYGDTRTEVLPNSGLPLFLSWLWWQNHIATDKRPWMAPNIATDMSFADYQSNRDPAMEAVLAYTPGKAPFDVAALSALALKGDAVALLAYARAYRDDPIYRYATESMEADINTEGYGLLEHHPEAALLLFDANVQLFPNSANAYDSKGECLWKLGRKQEAIDAYHAAISKDAPDGVTARNAKEMIRRILGE